jgi:pimeloyl-ACP methyl ester carboxylesterase
VTAPHAEPLELEVRGLRIAAKAWGPVDGPRVLAGHGWLDNANTWDRLAPLLPGVRIVAIDYPGHGLSAHRPAGSSYHFLDLIAELSFFADALGWDRFSLLGHSMGAGVASLVAGTFPERVQRMVLVEGLGPMVEAPDKAAERMAMAIEAEKKRSGKKKRVFGDLDEAAEKIALVTQMRPDSARILLERGMQPVDDGLTWRADSRLRLPSRVRFTEEQVTSFLERITCPTLLIRAREGFDFDRDVMAARAAKIANLQLAELDGHHHVHLDDPEAVAAVVAPFLQALLDEAS